MRAMMTMMMMDMMRGIDTMRLERLQRNPVLGSLMMMMMMMMI
jgi:hypothetical protein